MNEDRTTPEDIGVDENSSDLTAIDGEIVEIGQAVEIDEIEEETEISPKRTKDVPKLDGVVKENQSRSKYYVHYIFLPLLFLTVTLLGGLRIGIEDGEFLFLRPALVCLVFAAILLALFFRASLVSLDGWFREEFAPLKNIANVLVLVTLFSASTQVFNSLIPEQGLPFWIITFCFFWTLWNNLFAEFDTRRLLQSLGGLFGLAFAIKYLVFANLIVHDGGTWLQRIWSNPTQEALTYFLDLPRFASATGYIQFFALGMYLVGLYLLRPTSPE